MKQWKLWLGVLVLAGLQLSLPVAEAAPVLFTVCGQSAAGDRNAALQDAQKRAVKKALLLVRLPLQSPRLQLCLLLLNLKQPVLVCGWRATQHSCQYVVCRGPPSGMMDS